LAALPLEKGDDVLMTLDRLLDLLQELELRARVQVGEEEEEEEEEEGWC
jgi:hypothetical protein